MKCSIIEAFLPSVNNLKDFLNDVVEYETEEDNLNAKDEMVPGIDVTQKLSKKTNINNDFYGLLGHLHRPEICPDHKSPCWRDLEGNLNKYYLKLSSLKAILTMWL